MGRFKFCEDNDGGGDIVAILDDSSEQHINLTIDPRFSSDEARSVVLEFVRPGTRLEVYDNSSAKKDDDWAVIEVKKSGPNVVVGTFQQDIDNDYYKITYPTSGNLDGKVSHIKVFPGPPSEPTTPEKIYQKLAANFGNWPAKNGNAYEYNSQGSNYRVYRPDVTQRVDNGYDLSVKIDHIRRFAQDDHALLKMSFDQYGAILTVDSTVQIAGESPFHNTLNALTELPVELRNNKYVAITESVLRLANAIYADILALGEGGGRLNFPEVIKHNANTMGNAVVDVLPSSASPVLFEATFENGQAGLGDVVDFSINVSGYLPGINPECSNRVTLPDGWGVTARSGSTALMYSGTANGGPATHCYYQVFPVNILITSDTKLSYWLFPQHDNGQYVSVDFRCTDGSTLRDSGAVDYNGISVHPAVGHGGTTPLNTWTQIKCDVGRWLAGKTVNLIWVAFDRGGSVGPYRGYIDDIVITNGVLP